VKALEALAFFYRDAVSRLSQQRVYEQPTAHSNLAVNAPNGKANAASLERLSPGEYMLIDAVDQCTVQVEKVSLLRCAYFIILYIP
jgi:hypothetical protein